MMKGNTSSSIQGFRYGLAVEKGKCGNQDDVEDWMEVDGRLDAALTETIEGRNFDKNI